MSTHDTHLHLQNAAHQFTVLKTAQSQQGAIEISEHATRFLEQLCLSDLKTELNQEFHVLRENLHLKR